MQWPWVAYAMCDTRWKTFDPVPDVVFLINLNDALLGLLVILTFYIARLTPGQTEEEALYVPVGSTRNPRCAGFASK